MPQGLINWIRTLPLLLGLVPIGRCPLSVLRTPGLVIALPSSAVIWAWVSGHESLGLLLYNKNKDFTVSPHLKLKMHPYQIYTHYSRQTGFRTRTHTKQNNTLLWLGQHPTWVSTLNKSVFWPRALSRVVLPPTEIESDWVSFCFGYVTEITNVTMGKPTKCQEDISMSIKTMRATIYE